jgi:hypothetical protein
MLRHLLIACSKQGILQTFTGTESKVIYPNIHRFLASKFRSHFNEVKGNGSL